MISLSPAVSIIGLLLYVILISIVETSHEGVKYDDNHDSHHHHRQRYHYSEDRYDIEGRYTQHGNYVRDSKLIYSHTFKMSTSTTTTNNIHSSTIRFKPNDSSDIKDQMRLSIHSIMNTSAKGTRSPNSSSQTSPLSSHLSSHLSQSCLPILSVSLNIDPHKYLNRLINRYAFNCFNLSFS